MALGIVVGVAGQVGARLLFPPVSTRPSRLSVPRSADPYVALAEDHRRIREQSRRRSVALSGLNALMWGLVFCGISCGILANRAAPRWLGRLGLCTIAAFVALTIASSVCQIIGRFDADRLRDAADRRLAVVGAGYPSDGEYMRLTAQADAVEAAWAARSSMTMYPQMTLAGVMVVLATVMNALRRDDQRDRLGAT